MAGLAVAAWMFICHITTHPALVALFAGVLSPGPFVATVHNADTRFLTASVLQRNSLCLLCIRIGDWAMLSLVEMILEIQINPLSELLYVPLGRLFTMPYPPA